MRRSQALAAGVFILALCAKGGAYASTPPTAHSRLGLGLALFFAPAYPASDSERFFVYPYPYWDYSSPRLHLHHEHVRARWAHDARLSVGLGANGSPPTQAGSPSARTGMPALAPTFALGPDVRYRLWWHPWGLKTALGARVRYRLAVNGGVRTDGLGTSASGFLEWRSPPGRAWPVVVSVGPVWRSAGVNNYFFGVKSAYALPGRAAYDARGGYAGLRLSGAISVKSGPMRYSLFGRYRNYQGAVFRDSPLCKASNTLILGLAVVWVFFDSAG